MSRSFLDPGSGQKAMVSLGMDTVSRGWRTVSRTLEQGLFSREVRQTDLCPGRIQPPTPCPDSLGRPELVLAHRPPTGACLPVPPILFYMVSRVLSTVPCGRWVATVRPVLQMGNRLRSFSGI